MSQKETYNIKTEEDFNQVMEEIDKGFRDENVPIPARQLMSWAKFSSRFGLQLHMRHPLSQKVMDWFDARYGDKLKIDFSPGELAVMIRGDLYRIRLPFIGGKVQVICDARMWMPEEGSQWAVAENDPLPVVNVLNCIDGLTEKYAQTLSLDEQRALFDVFIFGLDAMQHINQIKSISFVSEAKGNLSAAVKLMLDNPPQHGLSKWESLQASEKFFKAYLTKNGVTPPHIHDLQRLANMATSKGLPVITSADLSKIQCPAGVRYGHPAVNAQEALDAHHTAIKLCAEIAKNL